MMATKQELEKEIELLKQEINNLKNNSYDLNIIDNMRIKFGEQYRDSFSMGFGLDDDGVIKIYFEKSISIIPNSSNSVFIKVR